MITLTNALKRFEFGQDVSGEECVSSGYFSVWRAKYGRLLVRGYATHDHGYHMETAFYDPADLLSTWQGIPYEYKKRALSVYGLKEDPYEKLTELPTEDLEICSLIENAGSGWLTWPNSYTAPNLLRALDFDDTWEADQEKKYIARARAQANKERDEYNRLAEKYGWKRI